MPIFLVYRCKLVQQNKAVSSVSSISKYVCTVTGTSGFSQTYEALESHDSDVLFDLGGISNSGYYSLSVYAVDSRGIQSSPVVKQNAFEILDYHIPIASTFSLERQGNFEQEVDLYIKCLISKVNNKNSSFSVSYRKCTSGTQSWGDWENISNITSSSNATDYIKIINQSSFLILDRGSSYDFQFKFKDKFSEVVINPTVPQGIAPLSVFEDGTVAVNRVPDFNQTDRAKLQVGGDVMLHQDNDGKDVFVLEELKNINSSITELKEIDKQHSSKFEGKVNLSDIVDNLDTKDANKPLSANQGSILKQNIETNISGIKGNILNGLSKIAMRQDVINPNGQNPVMIGTLDNLFGSYTDVGTCYVQASNMDWTANNHHIVSTVVRSSDRAIIVYFDTNFTGNMRIATFGCKY